MYVNQGVMEPLILMSQDLGETCQAGYNTPGELNNAFPPYAAKSISLKNYHGSLFKGVHLGNYQLMHDFPGMGAATELPEHIKKLMGITGTVNWPGAYRSLGE